jgi:hypothetical protein
MHGFNAVLKRKRYRRQYRSARRHFRHGLRAAVMRAVTAAKLYASGSASTITIAAASCGSSEIYVKAAITLLRAENAVLLERVLTGDISLLRAAAQTKRIADLVAAYRCANDADRIAFMRACGTENILDELAEAAS